LKEEERIPDTLAQLGEICKTAEANIIKLPNVSASLPQLNEAITELRTKGYDIPLYVPKVRTWTNFLYVTLTIIIPSKPTTEKEKVINSRYAKVLGSAVNPVLREGNSDRRVASPVKAYARRNPHKMGHWVKSSKSHVAHMVKGDFYGSEKSAIMDKACSVRIELVGDDGSVTVLKESVKLLQVSQKGFATVTAVTLSCLHVSA